jgi:hypothetical protein
MDALQSLRKDHIKAKERKKNTHQLITKYFEKSEMRYYFDLGQRLYCDIGQDTYLIKPVHHSSLRNLSFILLEPLPNFSLMKNPDFFEVAGILFQKIKINFDYSRLNNKLEAFDVVLSLYQSSRYFRMLKPMLNHQDLITNQESSMNFDTVEEFSKVSSSAFENLFKELSNRVGEKLKLEISNFSTGFVHEDLHWENILTNKNEKLLIDLDPVVHSYTFLNFVYFYILSCEGENSNEFKKKIISKIKKVVLETEMESFNYFLSIAIFRLLIKRAFHIDYYSLNWEDEVQYHFLNLYQELRI